MRLTTILIIGSLAVISSGFAAVKKIPAAQNSASVFLTNKIDRPLCYWPIAGDFVITNGAEFFNRPLYGLNSSFRIDGGDKPEFSLYLPGRGGNLRFGIKTSAGIKWLNDATQIVARYHPGSMVYEIRDPLLGNGKLDLIALPLSETKGLTVRAELRGTTNSVELIWAFGGANGMKGQRGGDIGCERQPVAQFFQLKPEQCKGNKFSIATNTFILQSKTATIAGIFPANAKLQIADATKWNSPAELFSSANGKAELPIVVGQIELRSNREEFFALRQISDEGSRAEIFLIQGICRSYFPLLKIIVAPSRRKLLSKRPTRSSMLLLPH